MKKETIKTIIKMTRIKNIYLDLIKFYETKNLKVKKKIIKLFIQFNSYKRRQLNFLIKTLAEIENYKKRKEKERKLVIEKANCNLLLDLLSFGEDFNRSFKDKNNFYQGIKIIKTKFFNLLKKEGLKKIQTKKGDKFNTDVHEAISIQKTKDKKLKGKILFVIESGYKLKNQILKFSKVLVGN
ncbi:nucleotide exchange factor GrpE [Candidatus Karelsulcia muelleri]|nr:nucleotide exchange factor GrpE [Candidatus Karelsulcia muelleri]WDI79524.1 nucleotide exchange factor GrpE [Candidatus Karelsulcia muelleri]WDR78981.1 nucleotide exchange factor GrpE [Candidatus Karelsulcia muelleri]